VPRPAPLLSLDTVRRLTADQQALPRDHDSSDLGPLIELRNDIRRGVMPLWSTLEEVADCVDRYCEGRKTLDQAFGVRAKDRVAVAYLTWRDWLVQAAARLETESIRGRAQRIEGEVEYLRKNRDQTGDTSRPPHEWSQFRRLVWQAERLRPIPGCRQLQRILADAGGGAV